MAQFVASTQQWEPVNSNCFLHKMSEFGSALDPKFTVLTWNVDAGSSHSPARLEAIVSHILGLTLTVDIVFFQNVSKSALSYLLQDKRIQERWYTIDTHSQTWGARNFSTVTLLSRDHFGDSSNSIIKTSLGPVWRVRHTSRLDRDALCCDILVPCAHSQKVTDSIHMRLINVHLDSLATISFKRPIQLPLIAAMLKDAGHGFVAGDFNAAMPQDTTLVDDNGLADAWLKLRGLEPGS